ncbi:hypothetical protein D3C72_1473150 [compost metagenome]
MATNHRLLSHRLKVGIPGRGLVESLRHLITVRAVTNALDFLAAHDDEGLLTVLEPSHRVEVRDLAPVGLGGDVPELGVKTLLVLEDVVLEDRSGLDIDDLARTADELDVAAVSDDKRRLILERHHVGLAHHPAELEAELGCLEDSSDDALGLALVQGGGLAELSKSQARHALGSHMLGESERHLLKGLFVEEGVLDGIYLGQLIAGGVGQRLRFVRSH